jgi:hypothetical protein
MERWSRCWLDSAPGSSHDALSLETTRQVDFKTL